MRRVEQHRGALGARRLGDEYPAPGPLRPHCLVLNLHVDVESGVAWFLLELSGPPDQLDQAEDWLRRQGVTVEPIDA